LCLLEFFKYLKKLQIYYRLLRLFLK